MKEKEFMAWIIKRGLHKYVKKSYPLFINILQESLSIRSKESILIAGDIGTLNRRTPALVLANYFVAAKKLGLDVRFALQKPINYDGIAGTAMIEEMLMLPERSNLAIAVTGKLGSFRQMGKSFRKYVSMHKHKFVSTPSLGGFLTSGFKYLVQAMSMDIKELKRKGDLIKKRLDAGREVHVQTRKGTDLFVGIQGKKSINNDGIYTKAGKGGNIPAGEVYIPPAPSKVEGKIIIDASLKTRHGCIILKKPVTMIIEKGSIVELKGNRYARQLEKDLESAEEKAKRPKNIRKIGELGIGTNPLAKVVGPTVINEKALGTAHIALGSNKWFGGDIKTFLHLDQVFYEPIIKIDGSLLNI